MSGGKFPKTKCKKCGFKSDIYEVFELNPTEKHTGYYCKKCASVLKSE